MIAHRHAVGGLRHSLLPQHIAEIVVGEQRAARRHALGRGHGEARSDQGTGDMSGVPRDRSFLSHGHAARQIRMGCLYYSFVPSADHHAAAGQAVRRGPQAIDFRRRGGLDVGGNLLRLAK